MSRYSSLFVHHQIVHLNPSLYPKILTPVCFDLQKGGARVKLRKEQTEKTTKGKGREVELRLKTRELMS